MTEKTSRGISFYTVHPATFIASSILSFGLFEIYWQFRNWKILKQQEELQISPFWRSIFGVFYIKSLFDHMKALIQIEGDPKERATTIPFEKLAVGWILAAIIAYALTLGGNPFLALLGAFCPTYLFLLPIQRINQPQIVQTNDPLERLNRPKMSIAKGHLLSICCGLLFWFYYLYTFMAA